MSVPARIAILVIVVCVFYTYVGKSVPQKELHPPADVGESASPEQLAEAGPSAYESQCKACHGLPGGGGTDRAPDLDGVATRAPARAEERAKKTGKPFTADDYLAESLFDPGAYLVERAPGVKYGNIMSYKLDAGQTLAVLAYLQTLGGKATIHRESDVWQKWGAAAEAAAAEGGSGGGPVKQGSPEEMFKKYGCAGCHDIATPGVVLSGGGPSLADLGGRKSKPDILMQIIDPDSEQAKPPEGVSFSKGLMKTTLTNNGFYTDVGTDDLIVLVTWLAEKGAPK